MSGAAVKAAREERGWDQVELARRSGVSQTTIARIELSASECNLKTVRALAEAFEASPVNPTLRILLGR